MSRYIKTLNCGCEVYACGFGYFTNAPKGTANAECLRAASQQPQKEEPNDHHED